MASGIYVEPDDLRHRKADETIISRHHIIEAQNSIKPY